jgi:hypothetical protein
MANKQFFVYKSTIGSFESSEAFNGILPNGRYRGFDTLTLASGTGLNYTVSHDLTGIKKVQNDLSLSGFTGIIVTTQGTILHVDQPVNIVNHPTNPDATKTRFDILFCQYSYLKNTNGNVVSYGIQKGVVGNPPPVFAQISSNNRIPIAMIEVSPNTLTFDANKVKIYPISPKPISGRGSRSKTMDILKTGYIDVADIMIVDKEVGIINYTRDTTGDTTSRSQTLRLPPLAPEDYGKPLIIRANLISAAGKDCQLRLISQDATSALDLTATAGNTLIKSYMLMPSVGQYGAEYMYIELSSDLTSDLASIQSQITNINGNQDAFATALQQMSIRQGNDEQAASDLSIRVDTLNTTLGSQGYTVANHSTSISTLNAAILNMYTKTQVDALRPKILTEAQSHNFASAMVSNSAYQDLDLTGYVPANRFAVIFFTVQIAANNGGTFIVKRKGDSAAMDQIYNGNVVTYVSYLCGSLIVPVDAACKIQYANGTGNTFNRFIVTGYL